MPRAAVTMQELARRAKWGGIPGVPRLTPEECAVWEAHRRAQSTWHPQRALHYGWASMATHCSLTWSLAEFRKALADDRREIADVIAEHPEQRDRLHAWEARIEAIGAERERDHAGGRYYPMLLEAGYSSETIGV
jgi:hypothetical protein